MDQNTTERLMLEAHRAMARTAEERSRLLPEVAQRAHLRWWMAARLRGLADRLDGRRAPHLRLVP
jgi:hypothetical protein